MKRYGAPAEGGTASEQITKKIEALGDWRGEMLGKLRALIHEADPSVVEEWKWMGTPVFSHDGIVTTGETYKEVVKLTFAKGAFLKDPAGLFNSSLEGNLRRAIDVRQGEKIKVAALKALIREAVALNLEAKAKKAKPAKVASKTATKGATKVVKKSAKPTKAAPKKRATRG